ncbi:hypothetical protein GA840_07255 [Pediococcus ethanolidurans]|uniref:hypothetical protein n=1 Tax=Pediococcus ethanolidurans TaxID=319653 RepID=UPI0029549F85|nr:hypothetical protein [Pediococcus ethanolidurans]MDV7719643.1 hypothetical protein [Pediococcus ethanolidurans]
MIWADKWEDGVNEKVFEDPLRKDSEEMIDACLTMCFLDDSVEGSDTDTVRACTLMKKSWRRYPCNW